MEILRKREFLGCVDIQWRFIYRSTGTVTVWQLQYTFLFEMSHERDNGHSVNNNKKLEFFVQKHKRNIKHGRITTMGKGRLTNTPSRHTRKRNNPKKQINYSLIFSFFSRRAHKSSRS